MIPVQGPRQRSEGGHRQKMRSQKAAVEGRPLRLTGYPVKGRLALQVGKRQEEGREADDAPHNPHAPLTQETGEPASGSQRYIVQPDGNDEQFGREEDCKNEEPRQQAKGQTAKQRNRCAISLEKPR